MELINKDPFGVCVDISGAASIVKHAVLFNRCDAVVLRSFLEYELREWLP